MKPIIDISSGIYKITNTVTGDFYIGSSCSIRKRLNSHRWALANNVHDNVHLQRAWNKYGEDSFTFETVLYCEKEHLLEKEQFYIDNDKPSYNICLIAGNCFGRICSDESRAKMGAAHKGKTKGNTYRLGRKHTEESRLKMSASQKGIHHKTSKDSPKKGIPLSEEHKHKLSEAHKGNTAWLGRTHTEESRAKISAAHKGKPWSEARRQAEAYRKMSSTT